MVFEEILEKLNKKGISTTVVGIILLIIGLAIVILFILFAGGAIKDKLSSVVFRIGVLKHSGGA